MTQSFLLTIYATYGILFTVPTEYPTYEQCVYHGEQIMEERMRWKNVGRLPTRYECKEK
jgi:hypothetical protein|tara:strand:+ start:132 stop:308 length:177 start_codon:yes stop_codon:yes gene_type:complete